MKKRVFSGIKPSGKIHLGNYIGAIKNWVGLQSGYDCIYGVVDLHAITVPQDPEDLRQRSYEITAAMLACGLDPEKSILFNQAKVSAHSELTWILNCTARMGWMKRMTQFKEKAGKNQENVSVGLFDYPVLMASDIILYDADYVPVGDDQKQHVELARDIAIKFNNDYKTDILTVPEPLIMEAGARIMSLRDGSRKMGKSNLGSDYEIIYLADSKDEMALKIRKAKTDAFPMPSEMSGFEGRPEALNLLSIYASLKDAGLEAALMEVKEMQFSTFKNILADLLVEKVAPIGFEMARILSDKAYIQKILKEGADKAREIAEKKLKNVYEIVGFL